MTYLHTNTILTWFNWIENVGVGGVLRTCESDAFASSFSLLSDAILSPSESEAQSPGSALASAPDPENIIDRRDLCAQLSALRSLLSHSAAPENVNRLERVLRALSSVSSSTSGDTSDCNNIGCSLQLTSTAHRDYARGFYSTAAMFNHSCAPNALLTFDSTFSTFILSYLSVLSLLLYMIHTLVFYIHTVKCTVLSTLSTEHHSSRILFIQYII